jgi:hypothetical protein
MSEVIETGSRRKTRKISRPRTQSISKPRKIDKTKDELELGHFPKDDAKAPVAERSLKKNSESQSEIVGPKRRKTDLHETKKKAEDIELQIASPRDTEADATPSRPRSERRSRKKKNVFRHWASLAVMILGALLAVMTAAAFFLIPRYEVVGEQLIDDSVLEPGLDGWRQAGLIVTDPGTPGRITLESFDPNERTQLVRDVQLPPGDHVLELSAQVQGEDVVAGPGVWDRARIYLVQLDPKNQPVWEETHLLFDLDGTTDIRNYRRAFSMPADISVARLAIELKNATGRLIVSGLKLVPVKRTTLFLGAMGAIVIAWAALILYVGIKTVRGIQSQTIKILLGVGGVLTLIALMLPDGVHDFSASRIASYLGIADNNVDVIGHAVMFAFLSFLVRVGRPPDPIWLHVGGWIMVAIASEVLQLFAVGREPSLEDLVVDGFGIAIGLVLAESYRYVRSIYEN